MQPNPLNYKVATKSDQTPNRKRSAAVLAWISVIVGGLAAGCLPVLMDTRCSMGGFLLAPFVWLISFVAFTAAVIAIILRRRSVVAWVGVFLGTIGLVCCTAYMLVPPSRHDF